MTALQLAFLHVLALVRRSCSTKERNRMQLDVLVGADEVAQDMIAGQSLP